MKMNTKIIIYKMIKKILKKLKLKKFWNALFVLVLLKTHKCARIAQNCAVIIA